MVSLETTVREIRTYRKLASAPFAWPGGYRIHFLTDDSGSLCGACVADKSNPCHVGGLADGWRIEATFVHWEGPDEICDHCGTAYPSEYGDPDDGDR